VALLLVAVAGCASDDQGTAATAPSAPTTASPAASAPSTSSERPPGDAAPPTDVLPTAAPVPGIEVTLEQYRSDEVEHIMGVQVTNTGADPIDVSTVRLDWPGLQPIAPSTVGYTLSPGVRVDLPIDYGAAVCSDPPQFDEPLPNVPASVEVTTADGTTSSWPVDDTRGILTRVHWLDCRRQAVEHLVGVEVATTWTPNATGDAVTGEIVLTRGAATGSVSLTGVSGSVLLNVDLAPGAPTELDGDRLVVPIVVTSTGFCTGHALADSKKTYEWQLTFDIDGEEASISVTPAVADQPQVFQPVRVTCRLG
jgi:hypothetical protein